MLKLSVLDQSPVSSGASATDALRATVELARLADDLGYHRYWLAEHHGFSALAGSSPEALIPRVAANTTRIRVGSGGVMLPHYSPLKVAETFSLLDAMFPGRIDLGLGRAPGSDQLTAIALRTSSGGGHTASYPEQIVELLGFLHQTLPEDHPFARITVTPQATEPPDVWLLGSSGDSALLAGHLGLPYSYAHFISPFGGQQQLEAYHESFKPSVHRAEPEASMCVSTICAETDEAAERLAASLRLWRLRLERGDPGPIPTVEEATSYDCSPVEQARIMEIAARFVVGGPETVRERLTDLASSHGADELLLVTICHDEEQRRHSYELVADAFGLEAS